MIDEKDKRIVLMMIDKINRLIDICDKNSIGDIEENYIISDAIQFEFEKMYEDSTRLSESLQNNPDLNINQIRGIRNRVAHDYTSVIIAVLVDTVKKDLPLLKEKLLSLIN